MYADFLNTCSYVRKISIAILKDGNYSAVFNEGDSGDVCSLCADWRCTGRQQGFHFAVSAQHSEVSNECPSNDDLVLRHG